MKIRRTPIIDGPIAIIPLTKGKSAIIDIADLPAVSKHSWCEGTGYARATIKNKPAALHRFLMQPPEGYTVDHKNGNPLDNRRMNLRLCSQQQQMFNKRKPRHKTSSKYKGVCFDKRTGKWLSVIRFNGKGLPQGRFTSEQEAAINYDRAAVKYFGEFANLNFPDGAPAITVTTLRCSCCGRAFANKRGLILHKFNVKKLTRRIWMREYQRKRRARLEAANNPTNSK